jgi:hypothetical protein
MSPISELMKKVEWVEADSNTPPLGERHATHSGVLSFMGHDLRVYRLNTGEAIIHADDFKALFGLDGEDE